MAVVIHLPKGKRAPKEPNTVAIYVKSRGNGSISGGNPGGQVVLRIIKMEADGLIKSYSSMEGVKTVYVIGYDEAKDHAINLDQLREYASKLINK
jgi:hypothetical protein